MADINKILKQWAYFAYGVFESWIVAVIAFLGAAAFHGPQFSKLKYDD